MRMPGALDRAVGGWLLCSLLLVAAGCGGPGAASSPGAGKPAGAAGGGAPEPASAAAAPTVAPPIVLRQVWGAVSGTNILVWLVPELGLDRKYGLEVRLAQIDGGGRAAIQSLLASEAESVVVNMDAVIAADLEGADLQVVSTSNPYLLSSMLAVPELTTMADLRGKTVAVSRYGSLSDFAARLMLRQHQLEPQVDVSVVQTGSVPNILAALDSRQIPAAALTPPQSLQARKLGYRELADTYGTPYVAGAVTFPRALLRERPEVAERYVRAWLDAIATAKRDRPAVLRVMRQYMQLDDEEILNATYDLHVQQLLPDVPRIPLEGVKLMLDELGESLPKARDARPEDYYDNGLLDRLESSGFVASLQR